ncbi:Ribose ABC transport system, ATP-binding protein RbsA (TC 3.A.1.2.1) [Cronobacter dublinensis 582]|nr:Ribose ABC transport system, ATP-binding protein RbsA (TC 3.A.1.2.1) [Cronobacter dublinensis 582]
MSLNPRLEMRAISLAFSGFPALTQVDFTLRAGSVHALFALRHLGSLPGPDPA